MEDYVGRTIEHYTVIARLGEGGMGVVYMAEDNRLGRKVALKFLPEDVTGDPQALERFKREAKAASSLNHPNICSIYDMREYRGLPYIVMELLEGQTLRNLLSRDTLNNEDILDLAIQVAHALDAAHSKGVLHRDIKPSNIFVTSHRFAKILDFGLAKLTTELFPGDQTDIPTITQDLLTGPGTTIGTIAYMSPEQACGEKLDHRTDLFSFGVVLYEMATGRLPFTGKTAALVFDQILHKDPSSPSSLLSTVPLEIDVVIDKALKKNREIRYQSARELLVDLQKIKQGQKLDRAHLEPEQPSIAVLPFIDMSSKKDQEYFCDGLTEELIAALAKIENLHVTSRTSSFLYKDRLIDIRQIGAELDVKNVLEGSVRKSDNQLRVTAQLINCENGYHLWSGQYDRELQQVFSIQEELAESIVAALKVTLRERERTFLKPTDTSNVDAYDCYLKGRQFFYRSKKKSILYAIRMFEQAAGKDPFFARAWAGLADCYSYLYMYFAQGIDNLEKAQEASLKALEIDSESAEAHASRGLAISQIGDYEEAEREFDTAIMLNPKLFEAYYFYARTCFAQGKIERASELFRQASLVNPADYQSATLLGFTYRAEGKNDKAHSAYRNGMNKIEKHLELNPDDSRAYYLGAEALWELGEESRADEFAETALSIDPEDPYIGYGLACFYSRTGRKEKAIRFFRDAVCGGFAHLEWIENDTDLDGIRDLPEFQEILEGLESRNI